MIAGGRSRLLRHSMRLAAFAVLALPAQGLLAATANAAGSEGGFGSGPDGSALPGDSGAVFITMVKVIFFLILIIGMFLIIMKVLAKKKWSWNPGRSVFKPLGGLSLGQNKSVQLVEIGKSIYVLGVGDDVSLLQKIDDPEEVAYITAFLSPESQAAGQGWQMLRDWLGGKSKGGKPALEDEDQVAASFQNVFQAKMKHMADRKKRMEDVLQNDDPNGKADS